MFSHMMDSMINQYAMAVTLAQLSKLKEWKYLDNCVEHFKHEIQDRKKTLWEIRWNFMVLKTKKLIFSKKIHANKKTF